MPNLEVLDQVLVCFASELLLPESDPLNAANSASFLLLHRDLFQTYLSITLTINDEI